MKYYQHGGGNKTHEKVEDSDRVDSFEVARTSGWGIVFCGRHAVDVDLEDDCCYLYFPEPNRPTPELHRPIIGRYQRINLSFSLCGFGKYQTFFVCPKCGTRARYLYLLRGRYICRRCGKLNYESQQWTKDEYHAYKRGIKYAQKHLDPLYHPDTVDFANTDPEKPYYMHWNTYDRHLDRLHELQDEYELRQEAEFNKILRQLGRR